MCLSDPGGLSILAEAEKVERESWEEAEEVAAMVVAWMVGAAMVEGVMEG